MGAIIKAGDWHESGDDIRSAAFNFQDMSHRAEDYLETVRGQAAEIIAVAQRKVEQIQQQAIAQGQATVAAQVDRAVQDRVNQQLGTLVPALNKVVDSIRNSKQSWLRHWEHRTVRLAAAIARRVIRRELSATPDITVDLVREALQLAMGSGQIRLHLNPHDCETLGAQAQQIAASLGTLGPTDIVPNPEIGMGTCRVVTEFGMVDQTIDGQLERIEEELVG